MNNLGSRKILSPSAPPKAEDVLHAQWAKGQPWLDAQADQAVGPTLIAPSRAIDPETGRFSPEAYNTEMNARLYMIQSFQRTGVFAGDPAAAKAFFEAYRENQLMVDPKCNGGTVMSLRQHHDGSGKDPVYDGITTDMFNENMRKQLDALRRVGYTPDSSRHADRRDGFSFGRLSLSQAMAADIRGAAVVAGDVKLAFGVEQYGEDGHLIVRYDNTRRIAENRLVDYALSEEGAGIDGAALMRSMFGIDGPEKAEMVKNRPDLLHAGLSTHGLDMPQGDLERVVAKADVESQWDLVVAECRAYGKVSVEQVHDRAAEARGRSYHDAKAPDTSAIEANGAERDGAGYDF